MEFKNKNQIISDGNSIINEMIDSIDIKVIGHIGNCCCLQILGQNVCILSGYNNTLNLGLIIKNLFQLLDLTQEDGVSLSQIHNIPCRIILEGSPTTSYGVKCVGLGNFIKDKFIYISDLVSCENK